MLDNHWVKCGPKADITQYPDLQFPFYHALICCHFPWDLIVSRQEGGISLTIDELCQSSPYRRTTSPASLPTTIILVLAPLAPLLWQRLWHYAQALFLGVLLAPEVRMVTTGSDYRVRSRRHCRTPVWAEDHSERLRRGCGAFDQKAPDPLRWLEVGAHDALGPSALEPASVGVAVSHRPVLAYMVRSAI